MKLLVSVLLLVGTHAAFAQPTQSIYGLYQTDEPPGCYFAIAPGIEADSVYLTGLGECGTGLQRTLVYKKTSDMVYQRENYIITFSDAGFTASIENQSGGRFFPRFTPPGAK